MTIHTNYIHSQRLSNVTSVTMDTNSNSYMTHRTVTSHESSTEKNFENLFTLDKVMTKHQESCFF